MNLEWKTVLTVSLAVSFTLFYCEFLIYYVVISQCSWPELEGIDNSQNDSTVKALFLADPHLLGPYQGHWWDKLRREWQMHRAFQTALTLYNPEVVFILGDIFDEGFYCDDEQLEKYYDRFLSLFKVTNSTKLHVIPGNHDIGFHYEIYPHTFRRFEILFNLTSVQFLDIKGNYFILLNSMVMEGDQCYFCSEAEKNIKKISVRLNCVKNKKNCSKASNLPYGYSRPIVLQHFPMYRKSDINCNETDDGPLIHKNNNFREKWDCLSKRASKMIFDKLNPRLVLSGHIHHGCHVVHEKDIHEYTLSSFSWRNKNNPTFLLAKISPSNFTINKCDMPKETTVIGTYTCVVLSITATVIYYYYLKDETKSKQM